MTEQKDTERLVSLIYDILENDEESRNDDKRLTFKVLAQILTGDRKVRTLSLSMKDLKKLPVFATITRARALLQNKQGWFLPTRREVRQRRRIDEETWRTYLTGTDPFPQLE